MLPLLFIFSTGTVHFLVIASFFHIFSISLIGFTETLPSIFCDELLVDLSSHNEAPEEPEEEEEESVRLLLSQVPHAGDFWRKSFSVKPSKSESDEDSWESMSVDRFESEVVWGFTILSYVGIGSAGFADGKSSGVKPSKSDSDELIEGTLLYITVSSVSYGSVSFVSQVVTQLFEPNMLI